MHEMEMLNKKLQTAEKRQKQMVSFLGKIVQKPAFLTRFRQTRQEKSITTPRAMRKFVKHEVHESGMADMYPKGQSLRCGPELPCLQSMVKQLLKTRVLQVEYIISFPEDSVKEKTSPEFSISGTQSMAFEEGLWSTGFGAGAGMSSFNEHVPELGDLLDIWNVGSLQRAGSLGIEVWLSQDFPFE